MKKQLDLTKTISLPDIGEVKITRRRRCRRLSISINQQKCVKVSIPLRVSFSEGEKFLLEKLDWIKGSIFKINSSHSQIPQIFDENINLSTRSRRFLIQKGNIKSFKLTVLNDLFIIKYPENVDIKAQEVQKYLRSIIIKALRFEAKEYLPQRVNELAKIHGLKYKEVKIKFAHTRWGSCSVKNNINLNMFLIMLPDLLSDYIVLHELAHTVHKNHGPNFWRFLEQISGDARQKSQKLRSYSLNSFLA